MKIGVVLIACVLSLVASAQSTDQTRPVLTFEDAVKLALKNGVLLNQQRNNLNLSQIQKASSIASAGPTVSGTLSATRTSGNSFNPNIGQVINGVRDNVQGSINAQMNLFSGFNRLNSIRQFSNQLEAQSYFVSRTAQDMINTVSNQYLLVMLDVELVKIARQNFEALDKQLQQVKEQVALGARSPVEEYNQNAQTRAAELRFVQAQITLDNDRALLAQTLLLDPLDEFEVEQPNWDINQVGGETLKIEELAEQAKQYRGDYLRAVKFERGQKFGTYAAFGRSMPSLAAFAGYGSAYNFQHDVPKTVVDPTTNLEVANPSYPRPFSEQFKTNNVAKFYGLQLNIPLFNGLQNRTLYVQQKVAYENAKINRQNLEMQIRSDVYRAVKTYEGAKKAYAVTQEQLKAAEFAFQLETERYNLGVTNFVDFANANRVLIQAQTDEAQAEYRLVFQKILIEYAAGTLKPENFQKQ
jgi:outer membrane protein